MAGRIGVVSGGGDCPGINAVIRAVALAAQRRGWETLGILGGFDGLIEPVEVRPIEESELHALLTRGGTVLGSANRGAFAAKVGGGEVRRLPDALLDEVRDSVERMGLAGLVVIGGDGTMSIALQLHEHGIPVVGVPKTIDNDLDGTLQTFGFDSAVAYATDAVDRLQTTAESHRRAIVLEVMGRHAGWIALYAGLAGGADVILIPELPFRHRHVAEAVEALAAAGHHHAIVVVAEGARAKGEAAIVAQAVAEGEVRLGGIGAQVAAEIERRTGKDARLVVLGHLQRGGPPSHFDRALCTVFGANAVELVATGQTGRLVAYAGRGIDSVPLADAVARLRTVPPDGAMLQTARAMGISFGDAAPRG
jgi:ATP-dependent phosphofructokinase / diphosphate-dependent phosphofructokinase